MITAEQIQQNWDRLIQVIDTFIGDERKGELKKLYLDHQERIMMAPASAKNWHHSAFVGGYVDHVLRVTKCALKLKKLWEEMGTIDDSYTEEELVFAALNHDLGKIGYDAPGSEYYTPNDSDWHVKNLGQVYKYNTAISAMKVPDRSLFILQGRGIRVSENEFLAIKLHDGIYDEANKFYYMAGQKETRLRTHLPLLLHHADHMASQIEFEMWEKDNPVNGQTTTKPKNASKADKTLRKAKQADVGNNPKLAENTISVISSFFDNDDE